MSENFKIVDRRSTDEAVVDERTIAQAANYGSRSLDSEGEQNAQVTDISEANSWFEKMQEQGPATDLKSELEAAGILGSEERALTAAAGTKSPDYILAPVDYVAPKAIEVLSKPKAQPKTRTEIIKNIADLTEKGEGSIRRGAAVADLTNAGESYRRPNGTPMSKAEIVVLKMNEQQVRDGLPARGVERQKEQARVHVEKIDLILNDHEKVEAIAQKENISVREAYAKLEHDFKEATQNKQELETKLDAAPERVSAKQTNKLLKNKEALEADAREKGIPAQLLDKLLRRGSGSAIAESVEQTKPKLTDRFLTTIKMSNVQRTARTEARTERIVAAADRETARQERYDAFESEARAELGPDAGELEVVLLKNQKINEFNATEREKTKVEKSAAPKVSFKDVYNRFKASFTPIDKSKYNLETFEGKVELEKERNNKLRNGLIGAAAVLGAAALVSRLVQNYGVDLSAVEATTNIPLDSDFGKGYALADSADVTRNVGHHSNIDIDRNLGHHDNTEVADEIEPVGFNNHELGEAISYNRTEDAFYDLNKSSEAAYGDALVDMSDGDLSQQRAQEAYAELEERWYDSPTQRAEKMAQLGILPNGAGGLIENPTSDDINRIADLMESNDAFNGETYDALLQRTDSLELRLSEITEAYDGGYIVVDANGNQTYVESQGVPPSGHVLEFIQPVYDSEGNLTSEYVVATARIECGGQPTDTIIYVPPEDVIVPPVETGNETGEETGTETGEETGSETGFETGTETGEETGVETGEETGDETGIETGEETGIETGEETGVETGIETGEETGVETGEETGDETGIETGEETGEETGTETGEETGTETGEETGEETGDEDGKDYTGGTETPEGVDPETVTYDPETDDTEDPVDSGNGTDSPSIGEETPPENPGTETETEAPGTTENETPQVETPQPEVNGDTGGNYTDEDLANQQAEEAAIAEQERANAEAAEQARIAAEQQAAQEALIREQAGIGPDGRPLNP